VLSIFPGIDLLGMAFEDEGFTIVRGPDPIFGGDIRRFHPPAGKFEGIIGGPPCQSFSRLVHLVRANGYEPRHGDMIPEFRRVLDEAQSAWWVMENVPAAYAPVEPCFELKLNNRWVGGVQPRERIFWSNLELRRFVQLEALEPMDESFAVVAGHGMAPGQRGGSGKLKRKLRITTKAHAFYEPSTGHPKGGTMSLEEMCRLQGLPENFTEEMPFTVHGKRRVVGNGVPIPLGRAIARAVKRAIKESTPEVQEMTHR
jgi:DNA (cytosine-5)-methyltransferase 1